MSTTEGPRIAPRARVQVLSNIKVSGLSFMIVILTKAMTLASETQLYLLIFNMIKLDD